MQKKDNGQKMIVLGLETSTPMAAVAIVSLNETLAELKVNLKVDYSSKLLSTIDYLLSCVGLELADLSGFSVSIGPGSFTGLRIGLATIKGLAYSLGKPIAGVPSLDAVAWQFGYASCPVASIIDAKKGELYIALYKGNGRDDIERIGPYLALPPERLSRMIAGKTLFVGPGVGTFKEKLSKILKDKALFLTDEISYVSGEAIARMGMKKLLCGKGENIQRLEPLYVRESDAQLGCRKAKS